MTDILLLDGIPSVTHDKIDKLKRVISKKIQETCQIKCPYFELIKDGNYTKDFLLIKSNKEDINKIIILLDNFQFDKKHILKCSLISSFYIENTDIDTFTPSLNLIDKSYDYMDQYARSQFFIHHGKNLNNLNIYLNNYQTPKQKDIILDCNININTNNINFVGFSPLGTYLYVIYNDCVKLFICRDLRFYSLFSIKSVQIIKFSSNETYISLWNNDIHLYEIITDKCIKKILNSPLEFQFSFDENYLVRMCTNNQIDIFDIKREIFINRIYDIQSYSLSNVSNMISWYTQSDKNRPAIITITDLEKVYDITHLKTLSSAATKSIYNVEKIEFIWSKEKNLLACIVTRKNTHPNILLIIDIKNKIEISNIELHYNLVDIKWCDNKLATLNIKNNFTLYQSNKELFSIPNKIFKQLYWSPDGRFLLLTNLVFDESIEILDIQRQKIKCSLVFKGLTNICWDPTSRFFCAFSSMYFNKKYNGYKIYTFQGDLETEIGLSSNVLK